MNEVRTLSPVARALLERWLAGMNQGGHDVTPEAIAEVARVAEQVAPSVPTL